MGGKWLGIDSSKGTPKNKIAILGWAMPTVTYDGHCPPSSFNNRIGMIYFFNNELTAQLAYLNALTRLEQTVGITLETWQITVETLEE
jgi:hypothetical protein